MTSKPVVIWVPITKLPMLVERKSKQTALNNKPKPMSLPINDLSYCKYENKNWNYFWNYFQNSYRNSFRNFLLEHFQNSEQRNQIFSKIPMTRVEPKIHLYCIFSLICFIYRWNFFRYVDDCRFFSYLFLSIHIFLFYCKLN